MERLRGLLRKKEPEPQKEVKHDVVIMGVTPEMLVKSQLPEKSVINYRIFLCPSSPDNLCPEVAVSIRNPGQWGSAITYRPRVVIELQAKDFLEIEPQTIYTPVHSLLMAKEKEPLWWEINGDSRIGPVSATFITKNHFPPTDMTEFINDLSCQLNTCPEESGGTLMLASITSQQLEEYNLPEPTHKILSSSLQY